MENIEHDDKGIKELSEILELEKEIESLDQQTEEKRLKLLNKRLEIKRKEQEKYNKKRNIWYKREKERILAQVQKRCDIKASKILDQVCPHCTSIDKGEDSQFQDEKPTFISPGIILYRLRMVNEKIICPECKRVYEII